VSDDNRFAEMVDEATSSGEWRPLLGRILRAKDSDESCACVEPIDNGGTLCGRCVKWSATLDARRVEEHRRPHAFVPYERAPFMCAFCAGWEDDARHKVAS